jgi:hypothetical protein
MTIRSGLSCRREPTTKTSLSTWHVWTISTQTGISDHKTVGVVVREDYSLRRIVLLLIVASIVMYAAVLKKPLRTTNSVSEGDNTVPKGDQFL